MRIRTGSVLALWHPVGNLWERDRAGGGLGLGETTSQLAYTKRWPPSTVWGFSRRVGGEGCWESWPGAESSQRFLGEPEFEQVTGGGLAVLTSC